MRQVIIFIIVICLLLNQFTFSGSFAQENRRSHRLVVIDPGFGGEDKGPESCEKGIYGKEINLQIAEKLARKIENTLKIKTILTRYKDQSLSLEERVSLVNNSKADLVISIHTNGHINSRTQGIETYKMKVLLDEPPKSAGVPDDTNFGDQNTTFELGDKLVSLMITDRNKESSKYANYIHRSIIEKISTQYPDVIDRGVKNSPFYILFGSISPAILIEAGFITNPAECRRLTSANYQNLFTDGIVEGIQSYLKNR